MVVGLLLAAIVLAILAGTVLAGLGMVFAFGSMGQALKRSPPSLPSYWLVDRNRWYPYGGGDYIWILNGQELGDLLVTFRGRLEQFYDEVLAAFPPPNFPLTDRVTETEARRALRNWNLGDPKHRGVKFIDVAAAAGFDVILHGKTIQLVL